MEKLQPIQEKSGIKGHQKWWIDNPKIVLIICFISIFLYSFYSFSKIKFNDRALLGGDQWEYQSMAVNYAKGHGFPVFGSKESFATYKMTMARSKKQFDHYYTQFMKNKGQYSFYRTPGYPFFLGIIYKIYGISPKIAKEVQLFMLILIASFLPFIGYNYWNIPGFFSGLLAGILFMIRYYIIANDLLTEPLIMFILFLLTLVFILHKKMTNIITSILLGLILGLCLLVKGSLIFLPPLFFGYFIYRLINKKEKAINIAVLVVTVVVAVLPWSLFATKKAGELIILSTQGSVVMLDGNNEAAFKHGGWHPVAPDDANAFYNKAEINNLPATSKLILFYSRYYDKIPIIIYNKLVVGFERFIYIKLTILLVIFEALQFLKEQYQEKLSKGISILFKWVPFAGTILLGVISFKIVPLLCILFILLAILFITNNGYTIALPVSFFLLLLNFVFLTIIVFGDSRFTFVIDFLFILTAIRYLWFITMSLVSPLLEVDVA